MGAFIAPWGANKGIQNGLENVGFDMQKQMILSAEMLIISAEKNATVLAPKVVKNSPKTGQNGPKKGFPATTIMIGVPLLQMGPKIS